MPAVNARQTVPIRCQSYPTRTRVAAVFSGVCKPALADADLRKDLVGLYLVEIQAYIVLRQALRESE